MAGKPEEPILIYGREFTPTFCNVPCWAEPCASHESEDDLKIFLPFLDILIFTTLKSIKIGSLKRVRIVFPKLLEFGVNLLVKVNKRSLIIKKNPFGV